MDFQCSSTQENIPDHRNATCKIKDKSCFMEVDENILHATAMQYLYHDDTDDLDGVISYTKTITDKPLCVLQHDNSTILVPNTSDSSLIISNEESRDFSFVDFVDETLK